MLPPPPDHHNTSIQVYITQQCATFYGSGGWPYMILFSIYFVIGLLSIQRFLSDFTVARFKKNPSKYLSLGFLCIAMVLKAIPFIIPLPLRVHAIPFVCDSVPKSFVFLSWYFLAIFFMNAFLLQHTGKTCIRGFYVFLAIVVGLTILASIAMSIAQVCPHRSYSFGLYIVFDYPAYRVQGQYIGSHY